MNSPIKPGAAAHTEFEQTQARRLRRMKLIPILLLLAMALVFYLTLHPLAAWQGYVHAFAEAAMVGALADWFAVTALFRHPLGIPIPHTAIIPTRKDAIGENLARFVAENFLQPEVVRSKLEAINLARRFATWLQTESARLRVARWMVGVLNWLAGAVSESRVRQFVSRLGDRHLQAFPLAPLAGKALELLTVHGRHQELLTQILRFLIVVLHENSADLRQRIQQESPWWLPGFVDDKIFVQMTQRVETLLFEMSLDPEHELRLRFNGYMESLTQELKTSPEYFRLGERIKSDFLSNQALQEYLLGIWQDLSRLLNEQNRRPDGPLAQSFAQLLEGIAEELASDQAMQELLNAWSREAIVAVVSQNGEEMASLISDTVKTWDAETTSRRVELAIGRDLQFIRINGTLVGGLVGLIIHWLVQLWG